MDDVTHIARCGTCGGQLNALPQSKQSVEIGNAYYHNSDYCLPATAKARAHSLWGLAFTFEGGNGLESR